MSVAEAVQKNPSARNRFRTARRENGIPIVREFFEDDLGTIVERGEFASPPAFLRIQI
jgi:hypothetical protein